jgi:hypothetical protein
LKNNRRFATRYDHPQNSFLAFVLLGTSGSDQVCPRDLAELPALSTGASDAAVHFNLSVASGMIRNQRLKRFGEPRGEPLGSDALGSDAGALPYQEDFVGETLGIEKYIRSPAIRTTVSSRCHRSLG